MSGRARPGVDPARRRARGGARRRPRARRRSARRGARGRRAAGGGPRRARGRAGDVRRLPTAVRARHDRRPAQPTPPRPRRLPGPRARRGRARRHRQRRRDRRDSLPGRRHVRARADPHPGRRALRGPPQRPSTARSPCARPPRPSSRRRSPPRSPGGGYDGPLAYRQGKPMRPDVALAFDRLERAARADGVALLIVSAFRSDAEQAVLYRAHPDPKWVAPPGKSLHRFGTELDLGPAAAYGWLAQHAAAFHFVQRYAWEPWHFGFTLNAASTPHTGGAARERAARLRARPVRADARARGATLERLRGAARRPAVCREQLQPVRAERRGRAGHRPVHARHGARARARRPVRRRAGDRCPGAPDARPAAPVRRGPARARGLQRGSGAGGRVHVRAAVPGDAWLCRAHPRPARRRRRLRPPAGLEVRLVE